MNDHDFEQRLRDQPLRRAPGHWRSEILAAAQAAAPSRRSPLSAILHSLSSILWPSPYAWGGLAAAWVLIIAVNCVPGESHTLVAKKVSPSSPQIMETVREQRKLLVQLIGQPELPPAAVDRPRSHPIQPRSDRHVRISAV